MNLYIMCHRKVFHIQYDTGKKHDIYLYSPYTFLSVGLAITLRHKPISGLFQNHHEYLRMRCLPHFFLAGVQKCGTNEMLNVLPLHPQIPDLSLKENHWWNRGRFGYGGKRMSTICTLKIQSHCCFMKLLSIVVNLSTGKTMKDKLFEKSISARSVLCCFLNGSDM